MDLWSFFVWDEFVDPGKPLQCPGCGALSDDECIEWRETEECYVCVCPDCGTVSRGEAGDCE